MDHSENTQSILSICTGIRGIERGIERIGVSVRAVAYVEIEAFICWNLVAAMESGLLDSAPIWTDLKTFPFDQFREKIHGIIGGYPCQPFSIAGSRNGEKDPRHLWPFIYSGIEAIRPVWCFFENVPGHLSLGYETVRKDLLDLGYKVEEGIFSAEEVGAPHQRKRLFILAVLGNSEGNDQLRVWAKETGLQKSIGRSSKELADTDSQITGGGSGKILDPSPPPEGQTWSENRERMWNESFDSSTNMGNTNSGNVIDVSRESGEVSSKISLASDMRCDKRRVDRFPAPPGTEQYGWEAPRTTQSGMGCTINGYNFREDLLRALGNGVVEQTAELAFRELIKKHINGAKQNI